MSAHGTLPRAAARPVQPPADSQLRWAASYVRPYGRQVVIVALLSVGEILFRILSPWSLAAVVDYVLGRSPVPHWLMSTLSVIPGLSTTSRVQLLLVFVAFGVLVQFCHQLTITFHGRISVVVAQDLVRNLREELFAHLQALTLTQHTKTPTGDAVYRLEADARCLEQIVFRGIFPLLSSVLTLAVMFAVLVNIHVALALISLSIVPPLYLWLKYYTRRIAPMADYARALDSRLTSRLHESFAAIRLIKSLAREDVEAARFAEAARGSAEAWVHVGHRDTVFALVVGFLTTLGSSAVVLAGGFAVLDERITLGTLLLVLAYLGFVYGPLSAIARTTGDLQPSFASARRVRAALALVPETADAPHALDASGIRGEVRFEHVSFAYEAGDLVLDDVSFEAHVGEMIALVGPSGAGKSTLAGLLTRFYERSSGRILIDGVDIDLYQLRSLRHRIAIVLQEAVIMSGTVLENLRYGHLDATDAQVEDAARAANAHEFIMRLKHGYHTMLGPGGAQLSGGQKQRLSIARAFLKDAPILILDEPTAALDTIAESLVVDALHRLRVGRTTFVVAHRLATVREADRILLLDAGRIVAEGPHLPLLETSALYRKLVTELSTPRHDDF